MASKKSDKYKKYSDPPSWEKKEDQSILSDHDGLIKCSCGRICPTKDVYWTHKQHCDEEENGGSVKQPVSEELCEKWRSSVLQGSTAAKLSDEFDYSKSTIRAHIKGECNHSDSIIQWDTVEDEWVEA